MACACPPSRVPALLELLEPRLLLAAAAPSPPLDGVTIIGNHPHAVRAFAWADVDGDTVTPLLTGKGYVELQFNTGVLSKIVLNGTAPATLFSLRVRQFKAAGQLPGDGLIGVGQVADDGKSSLNTLDLSAAVLSGTIQMTGTLKTLKLGTYSGPGISLGGAAADKLRVTARVVDSAATLTFGGQIASLTVTSWAGGLITALRIGTLSVTGGDFGADLDIGPGGIGTIRVRGGNLTGTITTDGAIGNITVTGVASFDAGESSGLVSGGAILCPLIAAGMGLVSVQYTVTDLGTLPGGSSSDAKGINNSGQVVGWSSTTGSAQHAFLYSGGAMADLGTLPGGDVSYARDINNAGQIVGTSSTTGSTTHSFLYSGGVMSDLGTLPGGTYSYAYGINDAGQVVGQSSTTSATTTHAFLYSGGVMHNLGTLPGGYESYAYGINNAGQVVGKSETGNSGHAFLFFYSGDAMTDLGTLPGWYDSEASGINDAGQVVGCSYPASGSNYRAFLYSNGHMAGLGTLPGATDSYAFSINSTGQVVGTSSTPSDNGHAFLYSGGTMTDLNSLIDPASGWTLNSAEAINDSGQIVGHGVNSLGQDHAFLLTPTPGPATIVKNRSIGNITTSGGGLEAGAIRATGSIGNLNVKSLRYKAAILEEPVLDASGEPRVDINGNVIVRKVTVYDYAWGGVSVDLGTRAKLGNVAISGGGLSGTLHAGGGMGNIRLEAILRRGAGTYQGIPYASAAEDIIGGDLSAELVAEPGYKAMGIASITIVGGSFTGSAMVMGKIGGITTKCYGLVDEQSQTAALVGGNLTAGPIQASAIGNISVRGELSGTIIAASSIGSIRVQAGSMASELTARDAIGSISVRVLTVDARLYRWYVASEGSWYYTTWPSAVFGGGLQVTMHLGQTPTGINRAARMGTITGTGADVTVSGEVPFDPNRITIVSRHLRFVESCEWPYLESPIIKNWATIGGTVDRTGLQLLQA